MKGEEILELISFISRQFQGGQVGVSKGVSILSMWFYSDVIKMQKRLNNYPNEFEDDLEINFFSSF